MKSKWTSVSAPEECRIRLRGASPCPAVRKLDQREREGGGVEERVVVGLALLLVQRLAELHLHSADESSSDLAASTSNQRLIQRFILSNILKSALEQTESDEWEPTKSSEYFESDGERLVH